MVEGGIPMGDTEHFLTIGAHGKTGYELSKMASENALAILL